MKSIQHTGKLFLACILGPALLSGSERTSFAADDSQVWPGITSEMRPWAWWWWHGSAVDQTNITHELQRFHDAGLGGVQITSIYGVKGAEAREIEYLSPKWLSMMGYTVDEAHRLDLGVDMTLGSGWCFGGPTVSDEDANASVVVKTFQLGVGERISEKLNPKTTQAIMAFGPDGKAIDITDSIGTNGQVFFSPPGNWITSPGSTNAPLKTWTIYAVSQKPSGQKVKRPGPGGEGWMLNPAYPKAMHDWLSWFDKALADYKGSKPHAVFQDSYEYRTDWSPDFFAQFEKRRGYRLQDELPALFGDAGDDRAARVKYDYRLTLSEIMAKQSEPAWMNWAHKNGFVTAYQAHGTPGNWLDLYGDSDIPETEMFHNDRNILISKFASSAAHTQGRKLTGAETGTWLKEHFTETLADVKMLADDMFLSGVNHIYYHGTCYSPDDAAWPGWLFYASTEMNPRNPIWHDVRTLNDYIARCQSILQSGKPDNDVLLYWPVADFWSNPDGRVLPMTVSATDWFANQPIGKTARELWNAGYAFDYVSDAQLQQAKVVDHQVQMPGGRYRIIVVPGCKFMPLETFKQLRALADRGSTIIFAQALPKEVPGLSRREENQRELTRLISNIEFKTNAKGAREGRVGRGGMMIMTSQDNWPLNYFTGARSEPLIAQAGLSVIRSSFDGGWTYFIANRGSTNVDDWVRLGRPVKSAMILDPMTGRHGVAAVRQNSYNLLEFRIQLAAGESTVLRAFSNKKAKGTPWNYWQTNGQPIEIAGPWKVKFVEGGPALPADFEAAQLASWTTFPDTNAQAFAGTARYRTTFDAPDSAGKSFELTLGDVRQSARVKVNGKDYGTLILPPFHVVVDNLKPTGNVLEVEVTSVAANRIRDMDRRGVPWKIFKDINIVDVNYKPLNASNWPLAECGLLGPVTITPVIASQN